jgi:hypothetical protein
LEYLVNHHKEHGRDLAAGSLQLHNGLPTGLTVLFAGKQAQLVLEQITGCAQENESRRR